LSSLCEAYWQKVVSVCCSQRNYFYRRSCLPLPPPKGDNQMSKLHIVTVYCGELQFIKLNLFPNVII
jgi:hypothetical protein